MVKPQQIIFFIILKMDDRLELHISHFPFSLSILLIPSPKVTRTKQVPFVVGIIIAAILGFAIIP